MTWSADAHEYYTLVMNGMLQNIDSFIHTCYTAVVGIVPFSRASCRDAVSETSVVKLGV